MSENVFLSPEAPETPDPLQVAKLGTYSTAGWTLVLDGQSTATAKRYKHIGSETFAAGDRVLIAKVSGTYVILGKLTA